MPIYYDEDGNEINLDKPIDEIQKGLESVSQEFEEFKKTKEEEVSAINEKLSKLENKDFNFKSLRDLTEEQRAKLSATETILMEQAEKHKEELDALKTKINSSWEDKILTDIAGSDEELKKKVRDEYKNLNMPNDTEQDIKLRYEKAYLLASGGKPETNLNFSSDSGGLPPVQQSVGKISNDVKELGKNLGLSEEDFKKYSK
jgi:ABC-type phosphate transport system auxiliary subunit